jgi:hypothetical protein
MTADIYRRVAPDLTIHSTDDAQAFFGSPSRTYSIRAKAEGPDGATFVREAVVRLRGGFLANLLVWRQGT